MTTIDQLDYKRNMSKTCSNTQVVAELKKMVEQTSYRKTADDLGFDVAFIFKVATGTKPLSEKLGNALGFTKEPNRWTRKKGA